MLIEFEDNVNSQITQLQWSDVRTLFGFGSETNVNFIDYTASTNADTHGETENRSDPKITHRSHSHQSQSQSR